MATYYSPLSFFKGGKKTRKTRKSRKSKKTHGGFHPSIMSGVVQNGAYLLPTVLRQGYKLMNSISGNKKTLRKKRK